MFFGVLRDGSGLVQLVLQRDTVKAQGKQDLLELLGSVSVESVLWVQGKVVLRAQGEANLSQRTGDVEVCVESVVVLNESAPPPIRIESGEYGEDTRLRWRFLDLRRPAMQCIMRLRSDVSYETRKFLYQEGFQELETPLLFKSTPEGASEFLVPTRTKNKAYALPQSPQQYKQLLMSSGVEKYFQIAKCFRDEGMRSDRQPEFTQIDLEAAFIREGEVLTLVECLIVHLFKTCLGVQLKQPFPRISFSEAMTSYGVDKPDLRYDLRIQDITAHVQGVEGSLFGLHPVVNAICAHGLGEALSKKELRELQSWGVLPVVIPQDGTVWKLPASAIGLLDVRKQLCKQLDARSGDLILIRCGESITSVTEALGRVRTKLANFMFGKGLLNYPGVGSTAVPLEASRFHFTWVVDFPLFEFDAAGSVRATHHPFTSPKPQHAQALVRAMEFLGQHGVSSQATNPEGFAVAKDSLGSLVAQHYDLVCNGVELGGGSIRIHDSDLQNSVLRFLGTDPEQFRHLLDALAYGCPPHGGIALGLDRLIALMGAPRDQAHGLPLREVIPFPKSTSGADLLTGSPAFVTDDKWSQYHLFSSSGERI
eukprot:gb/GEZN01004220.1/.p1 GENE.gb/GEZN01004220.1/~~gb/GEZN01004220.1/.p1  ORF type:complete len:594 (-),score=53.40 gb/GEZN01004220.1/:15-1796(-)